MSEQTPGTDKQEQSQQDNSSNKQFDSKDARREYREQRRAERREYRYERSVSDGVGVGVTFIFIGLIWMFAKMGYLNFSIIGAIADLWPLIFVVIGVNIIFRRVRYVGLITWIGFLTAIVAYGIYFSPQADWLDIHIGDNWDNETSNTISNVTAVSGSIPLAGNEQVKEANLELNLSAGNLNMGGADDNLIDYVLPKNFVDINQYTDGNSAKFEFNERKNVHLSKLTGRGVNYDFYLNKNVLWFIGVNVGAADSEMNFSQVPVRELEINGGAGDFDLELGDLQDKSDVSINMAAGDLKITVPEHVGVKIVNNGFISDNNFRDVGLVKVDDSYQTPDYNQAEKVIYIEISSAASDLKLIRK